MADMVNKTEGRMTEWNLLPAMRELFQCEPLRDVEPTPSTALGLNRTALGPSADATRVANTSVLDPNHRAANTKISRLRRPAAGTGSPVKVTLCGDQASKARPKRLARGRHVDVATETLTHDSSRTARDPRRSR